MQPTILKQAQGHYVIEGELSMSTVPAISKQFVELFPSIEGENITIDLASVSRSDSAGVALLIEVIQLANTANLSLLFSNLPQQMKDIVEISGLLKILPLE